MRRGVAIDIAAHELPCGDLLVCCTRAHTQVPSMVTQRAAELTSSPAAAPLLRFAAASPILHLMGWLQLLVVLWFLTRVVSHGSRLIVSHHSS